MWNCNNFEMYFFLFEQVLYITIILFLLGSSAPGEKHCHDDNINIVLNFIMKVAATNYMK